MKTITYLKPFYGNPNKEIKPFNFGKTSSQIYKDLLFSSDLSPNLNAISSKLGLRAPSKYFEIWSQNVVKRSFLKNKSLNLRVPTDEYEEISEYVHSDTKFISKKSNFVIPGNHFYLILEKKIIDYFYENNIFFSTINSNLDDFDGRHSSLLSAYFSYNKLFNFFYKINLNIIKTIGIQLIFYFYNLLIEDLIFIIIINFDLSLNNRFLIKGHNFYFDYLL